MEAAEDNGKPSGRGGTQCPRYAVQGGKSLNPHMQPGTRWGGGGKEVFQILKYVLMYFPPSPTEISLCDS